AERAPDFPVAAILAALQQKAALSRSNEEQGLRHGSPPVSQLRGCVRDFDRVVAQKSSAERSRVGARRSIGQNRAVCADVLRERVLTRATLERQLLLRRSSISALDAVEHLVGLQAQLPLNPYTGLWSRLDGFQPDELSELLVQRRAVRIVVMRATLHLVTADDCLLLRPLMQPVLDRELARHPQFGPALRGVDLDAVLAFARPLLAERPRTAAELRAALLERFPAHDPSALAYACRNLLAFVQVPPRGLWGRAAQATSTTAESWLGRPLANGSLDDVV